MQVPEYLPELQRHLCETMKAFIALCQKHHLTYYACGGTAIGAVRHQGFIPWDDDIDVYMLREDYERLLALANSLEGDYELVNYRTSKDYYFVFSKFSHKYSTIKEHEHFDHIMGVYIDIFPLDVCDGYTPKTIEFGNRYKEIGDMYTFALKTTTSKQFRAMLRGNFQAIKDHISRRFKYRPEKFRRELMLMDSELTKNSLEEGAYLYSYGWEYVLPNEVFERKWFEETVEMLFEDFTIHMPIGWHEYLTAQYGDYMCLPPEEERKTHHSHYYINLDRRVTADMIKKR